MQFGNEKQNAPYKFEQFPPCVGMTAIFQHQTVFCIYYLLGFFLNSLSISNMHQGKISNGYIFRVKLIKYSKAFAAVIPRNEESAK